MARFVLGFSTTLSAATATCALRIPAPAARRMVLREVVVNDPSNTQTDLPIRVSVATGSGGTGTATDATPVNLDTDSPATWSGGQAKVAYTVQPTGQATVFALQCPTGGTLAKDWPRGHDSELQLQEGAALSVHLTAAQARTNAVDGYVVVELID